MGIAVGQTSTVLDRVLTLNEERTGPHSLSVDRGAPGLWQRLLRLQTTASVLYTAAHPDDEQGGTLTYLSRGQGVRTAMLTLNRGEGGANAIGPELFDGLGMIRTEELLVSDRHYGLDDQYFTTLADYGYSKDLDESVRQWGKQNVLRDIVRVIRINRPMILVSRFYGGSRDGHGNHQLSGVATLEAFELAGDPTEFPEQIEEEGLRPWQPLKLYRSNLRSGRMFSGSAKPPVDRWNVGINAGSFSPWLGETYQEFASLGLSYQRSQLSGRRRESAGAYHQFYERMASHVESAERESGFLDGIDTTIGGIFATLDAVPPEGIVPVLQAIEDSVKDALAAYSVSNPTGPVPFLVDGLARTRDAVRLAADHPDAHFLLSIKERQFEDAIRTALGLQLRAVAVPVGTEAGSYTATMGEAVPGEEFRVDITLVNSSTIRIDTARVALQGSEAWVVNGDDSERTALRDGAALVASFMVRTPDDATLSRPYFHRSSIRESRYQATDPDSLHLPARAPVLSAVVDYTVLGEPVRATTPVYRREANLPYGYEYRELKVAPAIAVSVNPANLVVPTSPQQVGFGVDVEVLNNQRDGSEGELTLQLPDGWQAHPPSHSFRFAGANESRNFRFDVSASQVLEEDYEIAAVARSGGREFQEGYQKIRHRDYDLKYLYRDAVAGVRGVDVRLAGGMKVGYVMGVGDEVPGAIEQMGAEVQLLGPDQLASADLSGYGAIVVGTRAYAVRQDLINHNQRLLDYARKGGNLVVLYQTQEFVPDKWAAFPAELPRRSEEVSEEDSPVRILVPEHAVFNVPNKISPADFDGWVEQRGSKFFATWDEAYTPMIETQDTGQEPQRGGWVTAPFGAGHYTYFAYAVHRQLPYSVQGAYRIFANVLSLGSSR